MANAETPERILVATRDNAIAQTFAASGAFSITPKELLERLDRVTSNDLRALAETRRENRSKWNLNPFQ